MTKYKKGKELTLPEAGALLMGDGNARAFDSRGCLWLYAEGNFQRRHETRLDCWDPGINIGRCLPLFEALPAEEDDFAEVDEQIELFTEALKEYDAIHFEESLRGYAKALLALCEKRCGRKDGN